MRWTKFLGFAAGVILAASSTVVAQTGPTYPTTPPVIVGGPAADSRDSTVGSGTSTNPNISINRDKPRPGKPDAMDTILPGTDPAAGR
jgi:hypothetical protein